MAPLPPLPTSRQEAWRFSNLTRVVEGLSCTPLCTTPGCLEAALPVVVGPQAVFHNGVLVSAFSHSLSLAPGLTVETTPTPPPTPVLDELDALPAPALTTLTIPHTLALPLHLIYVMSGPPSVARVAVRVAPGASVTLIEHHVAAPSFSTWQHVGVALHVGAGATLTHALQQSLPPACVLTRRTHLRQEAGSTVTSAIFQSGGQFSRVETHAVLTTQTSFSYTGLTLPRHAQHHDSTLSVTAEDIFNTMDIQQKNGVADSGTAVFQGLLHVLQNAQKTDGQMHVKTLLIDPKSRAFQKPELSILADDVRCTHGAALGGVDDAQLFYMQARGLAPSAARQMLVEGFIRTATPAFPEPLQPIIEKGVSRFLTDAAFAPSLDPAFEPLAEGFMAQRSATPFERQTDDTLEITDV